MNPFARPPWSGQEVSAVMSGLALIVFGLFLLAMGLFVYHALVDPSFLKSFPFNPIKAILLSLWAVYFTAVLAHVAFRRRAPKTWLPWK